MLNGRVLLLEDYGIIALQTEDMLVDLGADEVVTVKSVNEASGAVIAKEFTIAVLEVALAGKSCLSVAEALSELETPFVIASGFVEDNQLTAAFPEVPVVEKPYEIDIFASALNKALATLSQAEIGDQRKRREAHLQTTKIEFFD